MVCGERKINMNNMNNYLLPAGNAPAPVTFGYFPSRWQHFIWRNWMLVPAERLAMVLGTDTVTVQKAAEAMGLDPDGKSDPQWLTKGYLTILRNNWHILNYPQLMQLTGFDAKRLKTILDEEDFFYVKLGSHKPSLPDLHYHQLSPEEEKQTTEISQIIREYFPSGFPKRREPAFAFTDFPVPEGISPVNRKDFDFAMIHAYSASCGDLYIDIESNDPLPENLLACYQKLGINAVWTHGLLHKFSPIPGAEEFSEGYQKRRKNLKLLVDRCSKYGIKLFLYFNEPRGINNSFFEKKPLWAGLDVPELETKNVCTTRTQEPLQWLENGTEQLFSAVPGLGGILLITMSENPTNCHFRMKSRECPYCKNTSPEQIISGVVNSIYRGMRRASDDAKMLAYDWVWQRSDEDKDTVSFKKRVIDLLMPGIEICSVSENGMETSIGGITQHILDYSISQPGPAPASKAVWKYAQSKGIKCTAKIQANNSWELSAVPFIPVPYLVKEHIDKLKACKISSLMLSWTLGGYPGDNIKLVNMSCEELALESFSPQVAELVCSAWKRFSEAFRNFPFHFEVLYNSPVNFGPQNIFHLKKSNYKASMVGFSYDDLDSWRAIYPEDIFENQFAILCDQWQAGLDILISAEPLLAPEEKSAYEAQKRIATAAYCHFKSTLLQIIFVRARNAGDKEKMEKAVKDELKNTLSLLETVINDSRIGFEASNHYYYSINDLVEKIINCRYIMRELA